MTSDSITSRLKRRIERDFPESAAEIERRLVRVSDSERVQAAVVLWASGDHERFQDCLRLAEMDWRDALVRADLADEDWPERLDTELGVLR